MSDTFLNEDEIWQITEYSNRKSQHKQLAKMGIPFTVTRSGKPLVLRSALERILGGGAQKDRGQANINLQALERLANGKKTKN